MFDLINKITNYQEQYIVTMIAIMMITISDVSIPFPPKTDTNIINGMFIVRSTLFSTTVNAQWVPNSSCLDGKFSVMIDTFLF